MTLLGFIGPQELFIILLISLFLLLLPILALIDIVKNEFTGSNKVIWVLIVIFFNIVGSILYFLIGRGQRIKK